MLIAYKNNLSCSQVKIGTSLEDVWVCLKCSFKSVLVGVYYRVPDAASSFVSLLHDDLSSLLGHFPAQIEMPLYFTCGTAQMTLTVNALST